MMKAELLEIQGVSIPKLGLGTWNLRGKACTEVVKEALNLGYRHIDTAVFYDNEEEVGEGIADFPREELFLTTKIWKDKLHYEDFLRSTENSLRRLDTEYVDLLLIHWPNSAVPLEETLRAMDELMEEGKVRAIGVSNFDRELLQRAEKLARNPILNDQVKYHINNNQGELLNYCQEKQISLTAYSPLGRGETLQLKKVKKMAQKYGKSPAQISLRWLVQQENVIAIPKASSPDHLKENMALFDWELEEEDMERLGQN